MKKKALKLRPGQSYAHGALVLMLAMLLKERAHAQSVNTATNPAGALPGAAQGTNAVTDLGQVTVVGNVERTPNVVLPDTGVTAYIHTAQQIENQSQGDDAPFDQVILRSPGVAQDSAANGDLHVRGEHANLQYRINDVLLPEGISGFGLELDPRFVESLQLLTGALPAQYGFRTAGVVDIHTKTGVFDQGGSVEMYGGSHDTLEPSFEYGGRQGGWNIFMDGSYLHNDLGIENPTPGADAVHDVTDQYHSFLYASRKLTDTSRITLMGSASYSDFQIPVNPDQQVTPQADGNAWNPQNMGVLGGVTSPYDLNASQNEQNYYGVAAYQKAAGDFNLQVAGFGRYSGARYSPGNSLAALYYNGGVATEESRALYTGGLQADATDELGDNHTLRAGFLGMQEYVNADSTTSVFATDSSGNVAPGAVPESIVQNNMPHALFAGAYLSDEWTFLPKFTLDYGGRFDAYSSSTDNESQFSPRISLVYQPTSKTTLHAGYARYFTPPPLETVPAGDIQAFNGTTAQAGITTADPVKCERANYYDAGISQEVLPGLQVGLDGYYKNAQQQLDDGLFGQSLILSSLNYSDGRIYGVEFTTSYSAGGFSTYANLTYSVDQGRGASSAQFLWPDQGTLNYVNSHWINLDHAQTWTGSFGADYTWKETSRTGTRIYLDGLYGSGLRQDAGQIGGVLNPTDPIPNGGTVPGYYTLNAGAEQAFKLYGKQTIKVRLDVVNLTDNSYVIRSGTGVGVNAAAYGARIGFFGSLSYSF